MASTQPQTDLVLWDGDCAFCRRSVARAQRLDRRHRFSFAPYQSAHDARLTPSLRAACEKSLHLITRRNQVLHGGNAVMFILEHSVQSRLLRRLFRAARTFPFSIAVETGYRIVARNRRLFSRFF